MSSFVSYSDDDREIVRKGFPAIYEVLMGDDKNRKRSMLLCLDWFMDPYYGNDISNIREDLVGLLQTLVVMPNDLEVKEDALELLTSYEWGPFPILEEHIDEIEKELRSEVEYAINIHKTEHRPRYRAVSTDNYVIDKLMYKCNKCGAEFDDIVPGNYELVQMIAIPGKKVFLPTYGKNGYLDLMKRFVPEWDGKSELTNAMASKFENLIKEHTPYGIFMDCSVGCPECSSKDLTVTERTTEQNFPIEWVTLDESILE
ncbi:MAG: hypothetical protein IKZ42_07995 [Clostridiales bacterium]|nr:hypothetical protein [Clostridiales bacterium]